MSQTELVPPHTEEAREFARQNPGGWLYEIDPFFDPDGDVPPYGIVGAWSISTDGTITNSFERIPNYRPSPLVRGFPEPSDSLDAAIQLALCGYGDATQALELLLRSSIIIAHSSSQDSAVLVHEFSGQDGVFGFTEEVHLPDDPLFGSMGWRNITVRELLHHIPPEVTLILNFRSPARWVVSGKDLRAAL